MHCLRNGILALLLTAPAVTLGLANDIDTGWASNGTYTLNDRSLTATAIDATGKLLLAGHTATSTIKHQSIG
ncbi:MAG: hypothetical protein PSX71_11850 [bacterium]|nr:hypothetical protein [bacterium]